jgi:hypothetical protein
LGDYLYLGTSKGYFCSSDIRSDAAVSVKGESLEVAAHLGEQKVVLKQYGTILLARGEEKGTEYEIHYKKISGHTCQGLYRCNQQTSVQRGVVGLQPISSDRSCFCVDFICSMI